MKSDFEKFILWCPTMGDPPAHRRRRYEGDDMQFNRNPITPGRTT